MDVLSGMLPDGGVRRRARLKIKIIKIKIKTRTRMKLVCDGMWEKKKGKERCGVYSTYSSSSTVISRSEVHDLPAWTNPAWFGPARVLRIGYGVGSSHVLCSGAVDTVITVQYVTIYKHCTIHTVQ